MTALPELAQNAQRLRVEGSHASDGITVRLVGEAGMEAVPAMKQTLAALHEEILRRGAPAAIVDLTRLDFMNSSCFKTFVSWIDRVQALESSYRIRFVSNPAILWQRRSLQALKCFADELVSVDA